MFSVPSIFGESELLYAFFIPVLFMQALALAFIPSMLNSGAPAKEVGRALYCYGMLAVGILLMTVSGVPALYSIIANVNPGATVYLGLLLVFAIGGLTFMVYEHASWSLDEASSAVPHALYFYTIKFIGALMVIASVLWLASTLLAANLYGTLPAMDFWQTPIIFMIYGILISACTSWTPPTKKSFQKSPMIRPPTAPVHPLNKANTMIATRQKGQFVAKKNK